MEVLNKEELKVQEDEAKRDPQVDQWNQCGSLFSRFGRTILRVSLSEV